LIATSIDTIHQRHRYNQTMSKASPMPPTFPKHDPADAAFWDVRFDAAFTPWEQGGAPSLLHDYLLRPPHPHAERKKNVLIPGCGSAQEVALFVEAGWVPLAIDFSPRAVAKAKSELKQYAHYVQEADFFTEKFATPFDAIYERAFLCALPIRMREPWAKRVAEIVRPGGELFGFFFADSSLKGPPFGISQEELARLLEPAFVLRESKTPEDSITVFADKESWQRWQRR
jgi:SAM-dependent methyltransferase